MTREFFCRHALLPHGWQENVRLVVAKDGTFATVESHPRPSSQACRLGIVVPGMANVHSHAFQRAMAGMTEQAGPVDDTFWTWRERMYQLVDLLDVDDVGVIARWLNVELLTRGYTSLGEFHYLHHQPGGAPYAKTSEMSEAVIEAALATGMRLTHLPTLYAYAGFDNKPLARSGPLRFANSVEKLLDICESLVSRYADQDRIKIGCAAHSLRAVSHEQLTLLEDCWLHSANFDKTNVARRLHLHIAEQPAEVSACKAVKGLPPVEWLAQHFDMDDRWCLIHATHVSDHEVSLIAERRAVVGLCPTTEANLGDGIFPLRRFHEHHGRWGIGSDSHVCVSPADELRLLEYGQRLMHKRRNVLAAAGEFTAVVLYAKAARQGAAALDQRTGEIAVGYCADLVELDDRHPLLAGRSPDQVVSTHVFGGTGSGVRSVFVGGERLVHDGVHRDQEASAAAFAACLRRLARQMG